MTDIKKACPKCGKDQTVRVNGEALEEFLGCSQYPECKHTDPLDEGFVLPRKPWVRAPKPERCGHCGADGYLNVMRIEPSNGDKGDGWRCIQCGWVLYDPGIPDDFSLREGRRRT